MARRFGARGGTVILPDFDDRAAALEAAGLRE
jgi:hypothetical protein